MRRLKRSFFTIILCNSATPYHPIPINNEYFLGFNLTLSSMSLVIANHPNKYLRPSIECLTEEIQNSRVPHIITDIGLFVSFCCNITNISYQLIIWVKYFETVYRYLRENDENVHSLPPVLCCRAVKIPSISLAMANWTSSPIELNYRI